MMMNKIVLFFLSSVMVLSTAACSSSEKMDSSTGPVYSQEMTFEDVQSLNEYLNHSKNEYSDSKSADAINRDIPVFDVAIDLEESKFCDLRLAGNNIYYRYVLNGFDYDDADVSEAPIESNEQPLESHNDGETNEISSAISSSALDDETNSGIDFYEEIKNTISVSWNYTGNGKNGLQYFVESNPDNVFPVDGFDGLYYSDSTDENGGVVAKMLYWVQDDCFFSASVPTDYVDYMIEQIYADTPLAKRYY